MAGPIADVILLRGLLADTPLRAGAVLAARVVEREGDRGTLWLNGVRVPAQLPSGLVAGEALRVRVTEATAERVVLQVLPQPAQAPAGQAPPPAYALVLPGGAQARVAVDADAGSPPGGPGAARRSIALRFDAPALGRLDLVIDLDAGAVAGTVHASAGDPAARARAAAGELERALAGVTSRPATVTVHEREETLDVRA